MRAQILIIKKRTKNKQAQKTCFPSKTEENKTVKSITVILGTYRKGLALLYQNWPSKKRNRFET